MDARAVGRSRERSKAEGEGITSFDRTRNRPPELLATQSDRLTIPQIRSIAGSRAERVAIFESVAD